MKKRRKLKKWVKVALILFILEAVLILNDTIYKSAVNGCVETGFTEAYCMNSLK